MRIIVTSSDFLSVFADGQFALDRWEAYADKWLPGVKELCLADVKDCLAAGYSWSRDYLPVLNAVPTRAEKREEAVRSFRAVSEGLDERIAEVFGRSVDADLVLYLGLCSGAGWVTKLRGRTTILLGIEKILELDWCGRDEMNGLVLHELGHVYHAQHGGPAHHSRPEDGKFLWQLFSEGVAMVFEQELLGDPGYFHQDRDGWKDWCESHYASIKAAFARDLPDMTPENQRYFGDWVRFEGHGDAGYYLGARFVRFLLESAPFETVIRYSPAGVRAGFERFMEDE